MMLSRRFLVVALSIATVVIVSNDSSSQIEKQIDTSKIKINIPKIEREVSGPNDHFPSVYGDHTKVGQLDARKTYWRSDVVGKKVIVEGIAWGQPFGKEGQKGTISPWVGPHLIYDGSSIFLKGVDFTESKARGKTIRVAGTLKLYPGALTRWGKTASYFYIQVDSFEVIESVKDPVLKLAKSEIPPKAASE